MGIRQGGFGRNPQFVLNRKYIHWIPITKQQVQQIGKLPKGEVKGFGFRSKHPPFGDRDGDGVLNFNDCNPTNPQRHGIWTAMKTFFNRRENVEHLDTSQKAVKVAREAEKVHEKNKDDDYIPKTKREKEVGLKMGVIGAIKKGVEWVEEYRETQAKVDKEKLKRLKIRTQIEAQRVKMEQARAQIRKVRQEGYGKRGGVVPSMFSPTQKPVVVGSYFAKQKKKKKKKGGNVKKGGKGKQIMITYG